VLELCGHVLTAVSIRLIAAASTIAFGRVRHTRLPRERGQFMRQRFEGWPFTRVWAGGLGTPPSPKVLRKGVKEPSAVLNILSQPPSPRYCLLGAMNPCITVMEG
jgi:hypothetical protein